MDCCGCERAYFRDRKTSNEGMLIMKGISEKQIPHGSFIGNRRESTLDLVGPDKKTLREKYFIGDPQDCAVGTAEQMKRQGFVGIYHRTQDRVYYLPGTSLTFRMADTD